jgi:opacity protein-like surface antigen
MKRIWCLLPFLGFALMVQAQSFDVGFQLGASNYLGDLSDNSGKVILKNSGFDIGAFARYNFNRLVGVKLGFNYTNLSAEDASASFESIRQRNLSFRSPVYEFALTGELNIPGFQSYNLNQPISAYLFAGIGATIFDPQAIYENQWVSLQQIGTEGQGMDGFAAPYNTVTMVIPFGLGVKYAITDQLVLGLELGARKTFTDYLDDVSGAYVNYSELLAGNGELAAALGNRTGELLGTEPVSLPTGTIRGDSNPSDWYFIMAFSVAWSFQDNGLVGSRNRSRRKSGCY